MSGETSIGVMVTARERVQAALAHEKADRIPRYEIFLSGFVERWRQARGANAQESPCEEYTKVDIAGILAMQEGPFSSRVSAEEGAGELYFQRDSWGRLLKCSRSGTFFEVLDTAINSKSDLDNLEFENPWNEARKEFCRESSRSVGERFCPVTGVMGLFMSSYYLMGEFDLLICLKEDEQFCRKLAERMADFLTPVGEDALRATDTFDTAIWVYDELGNNKSSVISPDTFERVYLDPYKRMISYWKSLGVKNVILHCDGNCLPLLDLLIDAGFTGIQGVNPSAGMNVPEVKAKYGQRLAIIGGMCNIHVLTKGSHEDIEREAAAIVEAAKDGGVIIGTHSIDFDVPVSQYDYYYRIMERLDERW